MTKEEAIKWLDNLTQDIGQMRHQDLWDYAQALSEISQMIDEMPDIVKCKDCFYWDSKEKVCNHCWGGLENCSENEFCSRWERKETDEGE